MARYSKKSESTGSQSVIEAEKETKNFFKILEIAMNPDEFEGIWKSGKVTPAIKLNFIMNSQKYIFKEKGRETEIDTSVTNAKLDELDKKIQALNKLMNT